MAITAAEARAQILDELAAAIDRLATAAACLGEAYEELDDATADRMEDQLFRPVQKAFGRAKRTHSQFAGRVGMSAATWQPPSVPAGTRGGQALIERAVDCADEADRLLAELQDSMLPIESGDAELRAGLAEVRDLIAGLASSARSLVRGIGR
ncbi:MAG TPA: hypothetical protein VFY99_00790 [Solirubrobacterales bacterium]